MKEASEVFKSIRYAKVVSKGKPHKSTDDEEHGTVGEKEYEDQVKHVKKMTGGMAEEVKDKYDEGEYDREGDMAKSDLRSIIANAQRLHDMMDDADNLPEWVQSKITLAEDYISTVANYLTSEMKEEVKDEYARKVDKYLRKKYNKEEVEKPTGELKDACWKGYTAVGMKMKNGRKVPNCVPVKEEVEQLDEMPGANMDTRAVHQHLKKKGWSITRTSGGHDVFTHPEAKHHIPVPRHRQLKAPLVKGILKQSEVREEVEQLDELSVNKMLKYSSAAEKDRERLNKKWDAGTASRKEQERVIGREEGENRAANKIKQKTGKYPWQIKEEEQPVEEGLGKFVAKVINKVTAANKAPLPQKSDRREFETPGKPVKVNESRAKDIAKMAARRQAGMKEEIEPEDSFEKTNTPAKRSLSKTAGMVKDLAKNAKSTKKEKPDTFQAEPELSSQIVKV
jgi:predicted RNA binding protein YcfA (HicA-like mRNA interferase family)